jgi:sulfate adenylyltransferase subunit 1 (EFTu-like GTPase family)
VVAAVNKMDLAGYSEETFRAIEGEFRALAGRLGLKSVAMIPISALEGDNVVNPSLRMDWYDGPTLLDYLETVPLGTATSLAEEDAAPLRFPVQLVQRPDLNFRGFAGQVARGVLRPGQRVMALPSRKESNVKRIVTYDGDLAAAAYPQSITVELEDEIDLSRGEMLVAASATGADEPAVTTRFSAMVVWMHEDPLAAGKTYIAKHTTRTVRATVKALTSRVDISSLELDHVPAETLNTNEVGEVEFETNLPLFFDAYAQCRATGSLILIDAMTNATVGAVMILGPVAEAALAVDSSGSEASSRPVLCLLPGRPQDAERLLATFLAGGERAILIDHPDIPDESVPAVVRALQLAGVIAVTSRLLDPEIEAATVTVAGSSVLRLGESVATPNESQN